MKIFAAKCGDCLGDERFYTINDATRHAEAHVADHPSHIVTLSSYEFPDCWDYHYLLMTAERCRGCGYERPL